MTPSTTWPTPSMAPEDRSDRYPHRLWTKKASPAWGLTDLPTIPRPYYYHY